MYQINGLDSRLYPPLYKPYNTVLSVHRIYRWAINRMDSFIMNILFKSNKESPYSETYIRLEAFLKAWSFPANSKPVLSLFLSTQGFLGKCITVNSYKLVF